MKQADGYSDNNKVWLPGVEGIILSAGLSSRTGAYKMTLDIVGKTILERCIDAMYEVCSRLIIVGGYNVSAILPVVSGYSRVELVLNERFRDGMFSSVRKGLEHVRTGRFFLTPGDYPLISREVYESMLNIDADIVIPSYKGENGHPVLMKSSHIGELLFAPGYRSLKDFIDSKGFKRIEVQDEGILADVDTMQDYFDICAEFVKPVTTV